MTAPRELTEALMAAMEFTLDDLNFNRNGQLSERQRQRLGDLGRQQTPFAVIPLIALAILTLIVGVAAAYLILQNRDNLQQMWTNNPSSGSVVAVLIVSVISVVMGYRYYMSSRGLSKYEIYSVEGYIKADVEGIGPNRQMWRNELAFLIGAGLIGTMFVRNVLRGRAFSTRKEDYMLLSGYRVTVGKRSFHVLKPIGRSFENGMLYRLYYVKTYPLPMLISGEALDALSPISAG